ncbi:L-serine ammonia-lyase, iron-sulfur-dependent, subunit alpha [Anaerosacchariphilus polymeriproducens]|uniref:L-serine dehydratase n=1 Tax=Anaerosacchariphilus polymeriproducens TaxID=1812858 RepID=A0A371AZM1_9FIRM|nr:L-serine ammonia-lyase, iron-sulfur-dependent, subunit alpha [Anaerosacchariphilus polymeriproducens]RDU24993.1 L-serine ammonia-lyase, iron-sulfur-dependent, subunit alpha [Anaerosacchariphilus polymeriproducens]
MEFDSIQQLLTMAEKEKLTISELTLQTQAQQCECSEEEIYDQMAENLHVMLEAIKNGSVKDIKSTSGLTGGDGWRMSQYAKKKGILGEFFNRSITYAIAVSEYNAAMGKIVASPTAGSCGILPGTIISMMEERKLPEKSAVMALFTAGAFGMVIAKNASLAGAEGGCQAECGSASAMGAAALVEMAGGTPEMSANACAIALKNQLGLVCDPVAGLVEVPCIKRNAAGVSIAFTAAEMALAGIKSVIPADEVIEAMRQIGETMPCALRETGQGGLAVSATGIRLKKEIFGD